MKIGFIGSSGICRFHISALINNNFNIAAIGSRQDSVNCKKLAEEFNLTESFCTNGWEEVLEKDLDTYCICTNISITPTILKKALDKKKPVLVEKPIGWDYKTIENLSTHKNSGEVFVAYNRRYYKTVNELKKIANKLSGGTILVNIPDSTLGIKQFLSNGCHIIDTLRYVIGDFKIVKSLIKKNEFDILSISSICMNNKWNILLNAHSLIPSNFSISINSEEKVYELRPIERFSKYDGMDIIEPSLDDPIRKYVPSLNKTFLEPCEYKPGFDEMYRSFKEFILGDSKKNICTLEDATSTLSKCWEFIENDLPEKFVDFR